MMETLLAQIAIVLLLAASLWRVFQRAGRPGLAALVPGWNLLLTLDIARRPRWLAAPLLTLPAATLGAVLLWPTESLALTAAGAVLLFALHAWVAFGLARAFAMPRWFGLALAILPFLALPYLAFADDG